MAEVALALPLADEVRLAEEAERHGHRVVLRASGAEELASRIAASGARIAMVGAEEQYLGARLVAACDSAGVRLVVVGAGDASMRRVRRLGLLDALVPAAEWAAVDGGPVPPAVGTRPAAASAIETRAVPIAIAEREDPAPEPAAGDGAPPARRGAVVAVWGPHGAPGRTTVAIALAAEAAAAGLAAAVVDADTHAASVGPALGLRDEAPGFAAACRLAASGELDVEELERVAAVRPSRHGRLRVLTGLLRASRWPELGARRVEAVLDAVRDWAEVSVVDTGAPLDRDEGLGGELAPPGRNDAAVAALLAADRIVLVGAGDPIGVGRLLRAHAELHELDGIPPVDVLVNRVRPSAIGLNPAGQLRQTFARLGGIEDPVLVPEDRPALDGAVLQGATLVDAAPRSPARLALRRYATERLLGGDRSLRRLA
ncbi:MinD/ParA family ATP-binding protein [Homoserinibacter sp. YIM 151385]|uniref:MinD/ParA family ATP-binding protein n=1 Tax=Homoserinibacter sp. YIM 151385 TaxID=2985506 RepID=UPI0022F01F80|nr:regulator [Homoserinibacter sp. YIM 151385]WBU37821.1 regulator [Homoserinibacter sp. YIM 151385]